MILPQESYIECVGVIGFAGGRKYSKTTGSHRESGGDAADRFEVEKRDFHNKVRDHYLKQVEEQPNALDCHRCAAGAQLTYLKAFINKTRARDIKIKLKVVGHKAVKLKLHRAMTTGRVHPCMVFTGPEGVGKKLTALAWIQSIFCENSSACGNCGECRKVARLQHERLLVIQPEGAQIKVSQATEVLKFLRLQESGKNRFVIIDQAHQLNVQAANSLLKSFEEPSPGVHFILVTSLASSLLPTIRSRSQFIRFGGLSEEELLELRPNSSEWVRLSAQGRVSVVDELEKNDLTEIKHQVVDLLSELLLKNKPIDVELELFKDKLSSHSALIFLQQMVRDLLFYRRAVRPILHSDLVDVYREFDAVDEEVLHGVFQKFANMEVDFGMNRDRKLALESYSDEILNLKGAQDYGMA
ncbi:MAG: AAA family ATPase [Bdellovibrionales bacterium]